MYLFIHGYGTNITSPFQKPLGRNKGFTVIQDDSTLVTFDWSIPYTLTLFDALNPLRVLDVYKRERDKTREKSVHRQLNDLLDHSRPHTLFCHSLGCELLLQYLQTYNIPNSVKEIVFLQADIDADFEITNRQLLEGIRKNQIKIYNYFCPWDQALFVSSLLHKKFRAGFLGTTNSYCVNCLLPARKLPNLHTSCLSDMSLLKEREFQTFS